MWSGPRNISTAMMRSWSSRPDTVVVDEPFYARYLTLTGIDHPGRDQTLAAQPTDFDTVRESLFAPLPPGKSVFYQKHMAHHLVGDDDFTRLDGLTHCFLIRDPREMILSFTKVIQTPTADDLGLPQQVRLFQRVRAQTGRIPPVLDARDVLLDPEAMLRALCARLGLAFEPAMLAWPAGPHPADGVWAKHWYDSVQNSTGFAPHRERTGDIPDRLRPVLDQCNELYARLLPHRFTATASDEEH